MAADFIEAFDSTYRYFDTLLNIMISIDGIYLRNEKKKSHSITILQFGILHSACCLIVSALTFRNIFLIFPSILTGHFIHINMSPKENICTK